MLQKKRNRTSKSTTKKTNKKDKNKFLSPKYNRKIKNKFIAKLVRRKDSKLNEDNKEIIEILKGEDIILEKRKIKSKDILGEINQIDFNDNKNKAVIKEKINKVLSYDNISKENIYKCLYYLQKLDDKNEFQRILQKAKYSLTKNFTIHYNNTNKNIDFLKEFDIPQNIFMFDDDKAIIEAIKNALNSLEKINAQIKDIDIEDIDHKIILKNKIIENEIGFVVEKKKAKITQKNLQEIYNNMYEFLYYFTFINEYQYYSENQAINFENNYTLYLINLFYRIYNNVTFISKWGKLSYVNIIEEKMKKLCDMKKFKNYIFDLLEKNNNQVNKEIDDKLDILLFYLESEEFPEDFEDIINKSIELNTPLSFQDIKSFINNNKDKKKIFKLDGDTLHLNYKEKNYKFKYTNYNNILLSFLKYEDPDILEASKWHYLAIIKYFDEEDITYLKQLIRKILNSKLFKELYLEYSDVKKYVDYYFNEKNIDDLLERIKFLPLKEDYTGRQGSTIPKHLKLITSSYNISFIKSERDFTNYKILEMGRKLIIILYEIMPFLKRVLSLITNGSILEKTIESEKDNPDIIEAGRFLEEMLFDLENPFKSNKKRAKSLGNKKNNNTRENNDYPKFLNINKALKLLDPNTYDKNIDEFKKYFKSEEENEFSKMDNDLKDYIKKINFDIQDYYTNKNSYKDYKINCSRKELSSVFIEYISDNHNFPYKFGQPKLNYH